MYKLLIKLSALLLSFLMMFTLPACANNPTGDTNDESTNETSTAPDNESDSSSVDQNAQQYFSLLSENGKPCVLIYSSDAPTSVKSAMESLAAAIGNKLGKTVSVLNENDFTAKENGVSFILAGHIDAFAEECDAFLKASFYDLGGYGYECVSETVLCINGNTPRYMEASISALKGVIEDASLLNTIVGSDGTEKSGAYLLQSELSNITAKNVIREFTIDSVPIEEFVIVYELKTVTYKETAFKLQDTIYKKTGILLEVQDHTKEEREHEILFGNTGRELTNDFYEIKPQECHIRLRDGKLAFHANNDYTLQVGFSDFLTRHLTNATEVHLKPEHSTVKAINLLSLGMKPKAEGDIRVLSNNIIIDYGMPVERLEPVLNVLLNADADVLALQEISTSMYIGMTEPLAKYGYKLAMAKSTKIANVYSNANPIYYRESTLELLDCAWEPFKTYYDSRNDSPITAFGYTWALFKEKATGKQFIVISTHQHSDRVSAGPIFREIEAQEVLELVGELQHKFDELPIMYIGDYNCDFDSKPYQILLSRDLLNASDLADSVYRMELATCHDIGVEKGGGDIDHAIVTGGFHISLFQKISNKYDTNYTDHHPIAVDFKLN